MPTLAAQSVDLVVTSPPYAKRREKTYGGIDANRYVEWFLPISAELMRVLKPTGSFVLNIKEHCENGERHTYVLELILALRRQGWLWTEEYIWHKTASVPGKWPNRFRDAWERCLHFTKERRFVMMHDEMRIPAHPESLAKYRRGAAKNGGRVNNANGSGFGQNWKNLENIDTALPSNVLLMPPERSNKGHSAAYPVALPDWFIRLFTQEGDTVLDPFTGSGTTGVACVNTNRHFIGIESHAPYVEIARRRLTEAAAQPRLEGTR
jgi:site-specific DNA-methyltransferase (adenine-specific)/site-specific DNA-methyltransferase (cytosine-N4-specific)